jgi:hypothetical protein
MTPDSVVCSNSGSNGRDIIWECKASLQNNVKFGTTSISCEGYDNPNDPSVLKNSCGLKYTLDYIRPFDSGTRYFCVDRFLILFFYIGNGNMNIGGTGGNINIGGGGGNINIGGFDRMHFPININ